MMDRENVIEGLKKCADGRPCLGSKYMSCPFSPRNHLGCNCGVTMARNTLELLKENEPMNVDTKVIGLPQGDIEAFCCPVCRFVLDPTFHFCPNCGQEVTWNECTEEEFDFTDRGATDETEKYWERRKAEDSEGAQ